jgi:hypothetical protein
MNVLKDLWKDKPLFITVVVALAGVLYLVYKSNASNSVAPVSSATTTNGSATSTGSGSPGGTYVEESYYNNSPTTTTTTTTPSTTPVLPTILSPAAKGTLGKYGAGKNDTNFWVYTVPAGATLTSLAQFANWGSDYTKLANYRNNLQILQAAGVNTSNPYAPVPAGLKLSV